MLGSGLAGFAGLGPGLHGLPPIINGLLQHLRGIPPELDAQRPVAGCREHQGGVVGTDLRAVLESVPLGEAVGIGDVDAALSADDGFLRLLVANEDGVMAVSYT